MHAADIFDQAQYEYKVPKPHQAFTKLYKHYIILPPV
jgi:hypothetical protein